MKRLKKAITIIIFLLLITELFSSVDSTMFHFNDYPNQHLKLFFNRDDINTDFTMNVITNIDSDILGLMYVVSYYN